MRAITKDDLENLQWGATFCSSGGGGGWNNTEQIKQNLITEMENSAKGYVEMVDIDELDNDARGFVIGAVGRPDILGGLGDWLAQSLELVGPEYVSASGLGKIDFVLAVEIGANTFVAMIAALRLGVPIVDCDGARRAVPAITDLTYTASGISVNPLAVQNIPSKHNPPWYDVIREPTVDETSKKLRETISTPIYGGGIATLASWGVSGLGLSQPGTAIHGSISFAIALGKRAKTFLALQPGNVAGLAEDISEFLDPNNEYDSPICNIMTYGKVSGTPGTQPPGGWDSGTVTIVGEDGSSWDVNFLNENITLVGNSAETPQVMYPDLIIYIDANGNPTTNADPIKDGDWMAIFHVPGDNILRYGSNPKEQKNLDAAAAFVRGKVGYSGPYVPNPSFTYHYPKGY